LSGLNRRGANGGFGVANKFRYSQQCKTSKIKEKLLMELCEFVVVQVPEQGN
jgi:hypothetical protein